MDRIEKMHIRELVDTIKLDILLVLKDKEYLSLVILGNLKDLLDKKSTATSNYWNETIKPILLDDPDLAGKDLSDKKSTATPNYWNEMIKPISSDDPDSASKEDNFVRKLYALYDLIVNQKDSEIWRHFVKHDSTQDDVNEVLKFVSDCITDAIRETVAIKSPPLSSTAQSLAKLEPSPELPLPPAPAPSPPHKILVN